MVTSLAVKVSLSNSEVQSKAGYFISSWVFFFFLNDITDDYFKRSIVSLKVIYAINFINI